SQNPSVRHCCRADGEGRTWTGDAHRRRRGSGLLYRLRRSKPGGDEMIAAELGGSRPRIGRRACPNLAAVAIHFSATYKMSVVSDLRLHGSIMNASNRRRIALERRIMSLGA